MNAINLVIEDGRYPFIYTAYRTKNNNYIGMLFKRRGSRCYHLVTSQLDLNLKTMKEARQIFRLLDDKRTAEYKLADTTYEIQRALR